MVGGGLPEAALLNDLTADLRTKVGEAWQEFGRSLAAALPVLPAGASVELTLDPTASGTDDAVYSVDVTASKTNFTAFAVGNSGLPVAYRLSRAAVGDLVALGWSPPGVVDGSGDSFGLQLPLVDAATLAVVVTRTMRDVYGAPHPAFLTYAVTGADATPVELPALGTARAVLGGPLPPPAVTASEGAAPEAENSDTETEATGSDPADDTAGLLADPSVLLPLAERVQLVVAKLLKTKPEQLQVDADGDIGIRAGSAMVFVRVRDNPPLVDVFSPVLTEIEPTERLYRKLSELTNRMPIGRLYCSNDTVWASVPVMGRDFQASHLMLAVQVMTGLADELDDRLQGEFGGKRFYGDAEKSSGPAEERTGMYL
ncbi:T3SS (YopN, CesT) and YbjN peptide-binding chaperone 1 [Virgisporangium aurantiacum]|uniref:T3SS (YopN, CesT) and YbjN peptide-binding chaperone 1 n=1 Tax=Virgisporangium aurantiacum TaxID=175570 RepID=UPI003570B0B8